MKKLVLSISVVIVFATYAMYQKMGILPPIYTPERTGSDTPVGAVVPIPTPSPTGAPTPNPKPVGLYKDGSYTGIPADAYYGVIQVKAIVSHGKLSDIEFLKYPNDRGTSIMINTQAMPIWKSEAIKVQSANVDIVSGATQSTVAFDESLASALALAKNQMKETRDMMGMPITVDIVGDERKNSIDLVFDYLKYVDEKFSTYKETSEITSINRGKLEEKNYSDDMKLVFSLSEETKKLTDGYFDIQKPDGS